MSGCPQCSYQFGYHDDYCRIGEECKGGSMKASTTEQYDAQLQRDIEAARGVKPAASVDAILDERGKRYGRFMDHASVTLRLKEVLHSHAPWGEKTPRWDKLNSDQKEALDMICHKLGRIINGDPNYTDSWADVAGYAQLVADRLEGLAR